MTQNTHHTFTAEDLRTQVEQYLAAGDNPDDYDVNGIVDMIIQVHGVIPLDSLGGRALIAILMANDTTRQ